MRIETLCLSHPVQAADRVAAPLSWHRELNAVDGAWDAARPTRIVIPDGCSHVQLRAGVCFEPETAGVRQLFTRKNGMDERPVGYPEGYMSHTHAPGVDESSVSFTASSACMPVAPGDFFELVVYQTSGRPLWVGGVPKDAERPEDRLAFGCVYFEAMLLG